MIQSRIWSLVKCRVKLIRYQSTITNYNKLQSNIQSNYNELIKSHNNNNTISSSTTNPLIKLQNKEFEIYQIFNNILMKNGFIPSEDKTRWLEKPTKLKLLPQPPKVYDKITINNYIKELSEINILPNYNNEILKQIALIYTNLTNSNLLNVNSFNLIISFFARYYLTLSVFRIRDKMITHNIKPTIETMNICIETVFKKRKYSNSDIQYNNIIENLKIMQRLKIQPNKTTFYIMYKYLTNRQVRKMIRNKMR
ncbi:hypothetical protein CANARDRAFT_7788 [[Candida] arabinofermentans NRRL YB-2248]|uniref:Uncharacterized protein n=1 Tax=[Candida] arabinofermentans NRRL YB-2248 TaxID=983967 RepID=A0A1E4T077_9ASCO|nr:hypothetical protein CANARDRAFT_7788 [[Candida] arabinofermentans NRRL YB-2248]